MLRSEGLWKCACWVCDPLNCRYLHSVWLPWKYGGLNGFARKFFSSGDDSPVDLLASRPCYKAGDSALSWVKQLGRNVVTPAYVLRRLALSADAEVRVAVADHLNTPQEVLLFLAPMTAPTCDTQSQRITT